MTTPAATDYPVGLSRVAYHEEVGRVHRAVGAQLVAATLASQYLWIASFKGQVCDLTIGISALAASGESMVFDVLKNGVSILSSTYTVDSTITTKEVIDLFSRLTAAGKSFVEGDVYTVARTYTAGGGPTPLGATVVIMEPSVGPYT